MKTIPYSHRDRTLPAFTLIEMLTVITIMAIVAALVVTMGQYASQKKKIVAADGEKERLVSLIENYKAKLNYYPPDNGLLATMAPGPAYDAMAATNPLIYELVGATNVPGVTGQMLVFNSSNNSLTVPAATYASIFNRNGIANGDSSEPQDFFQPGPSAKEYAPYSTVTTPPICGLVAPIEFTNVEVPNFVHYDSSSTNRHNRDGFDLWIEYTLGSKNGRLIMKTNGNFGDSTL